MQTEREAFAQSLSKFTILSNVSEMTAKNVNAIRTLLTVALENSNYLNESWIYVFQCISRLERLQLISNTSSNSSDLSTPEVKPSQMYMPNILNDEQAKRLFFFFLKKEKVKIRKKKNNKKNKKKRF